MESCKPYITAIIKISCELSFTLIQLDNISCRFDFIPSCLVIILGGIFKMWSCVNLILCPIDNMLSKTFIKLIQQDNILCRFTFIPGRLVNILSGSLLIRSRVIHILCPIINISCETVIIVIQLDNISF